LAMEVGGLQEMLGAQAVSELGPIQWVDVGLLMPNPKNRNDHPKKQIERLAEIIKFQGWRHPIIVSNQSGYIVAGHGRLLAAKELGLDKVPVQFQDFENEDQEYAFCVSDNAIALWAELDLSGIQADLPEITLPSIDLLGIEKFSFEPPEPPKEKTCPHCGGSLSPGNR